MVRRPSLALERMPGALKPGGRILVVVKTNPSRPRGGRGLIRFLKPAAAVVKWTQRFPEGEARRLLERAGFEVDEERNTAEIQRVLATKSCRAVGTRTHAT